MEITMSKIDAYMELCPGEALEQSLVAIPAVEFSAARDAYYELCADMITGRDQRQHHTASPAVMQRFHALFNPIRRT
jgi:hypothetical protein